MRRAGQGVEATIAHHVRGVTLGTRQVGLDEWIDALARQLAELSARSARARDALLRLLT